MFTLLVTRERHRGIKGLWERVSCPRPRLEEHHTLDIPWRLIRAPCGKNGPDWPAVERLAGSHAARLVSSACHKAPKGSRVELARLMAYQRIMAARAICRLLEDCPYPAVIGVIDPRARCLSAVEILLEKAGCVKVYTQLPHRYEWFAHRMLEQKGATVVLCSQPEAFADCFWVLVGGHCGDLSLWLGKNRVAFSAAGEDTSKCGQWLCCFEPDCPPRLLEQIPQGVPPADLCSALYQFAACHRLAKLEPKTCRVDGRLTQMEELKPHRGPKSLNDRP